MEVAKVDTVFPGAGCLLCLAAASVANQSLATYTQKLPTDDIAHIKSDLGEQLRKRGYTPVMLPDDFKVDSLGCVRVNSVNEHQPAHQAELQRAASQPESPAAAHPATSAIPNS